MIIAQRLAFVNGNSNGEFDEDGFPNGYGKNNQSVLNSSIYCQPIREKIQNRISLNAISEALLYLVGHFQYTGLMNIDFIKERFKRFSLGHAYRSSYTLNNFKSNLEYDS